MSLKTVFQPTQASSETPALHDIKREQKNSKHLAAETSWPLAVGSKVLGGF